MKRARTVAPATGLVFGLLVASCAQVGGGGVSQDSSGAQPEISAIEPTVGPSTGGDTITIRGSNFTKDSLVRFGDVLGGSIKVVSDTQITTTLPASASVGKVAVTVTSLDGRTASRGDLFAYYYGTIDFSSQSTLTTGGGPKSLALTDLDGDGKVDIATSNSSDASISLFRGVGDGTFGTPDRIALPGNTDIVTAGDVDADNKPDLLLAGTASSRVYTMRNTGLAGAGLFTLASTTTVGSGPVALAFGELNGDGKPDAIVANRNASTLNILINKGSGMWEGSSTVTTPALPAGLAIADLNKDGKDDVAVTSYSDNTVQIFLTGGGGIPAMSGQALTVGGNPRGANLIDLNKDGILDLIAVSEGNGGVSVLLGQAGVSFAQAQSYPTGTFPSMAVTADINGDERTDLIVLNGGSSGSVVVLPGQGNGAFVSGNSSQRIPLPFAAGSVAAADVNKDGKLDLVVTAISVSQAIVLLNKSH